MEVSSKYVKRVVGKELILKVGRIEAPLKYNKNSW